jgi:hypothetical protein
LAAASDSIPRFMLIATNEIRQNQRAKETHRLQSSNLEKVQYMSTSELGFIRLMLVVALDRKACIQPVLLTFGVVTHIGVTQRRQFTGSVL